MAQFPSTESASGIWSLKDQRIAQMGENWPRLFRAVQYVVVAGGGGGGGNSRGGGGAGGYRSSVTGEMSGGGASAESVFQAILGTSYTVTVGAGGAAGTPDEGTKGSNSVFGSITSIGGGTQSSVQATCDGGSGAGAGSLISQGAKVGAGTTGQGFAGGEGYSASNAQRAGGGGGAGAAGQSAPYTVNSNGGVGGIGVQSSITGTAIYRAGGGGGSSYPGSGGAGGQGGGGAGGSGGGAGVAGTANTGGGGGAGSCCGANGSNGGSGIVIISYQGPDLTSIGAGLTYTKSLVNGRTVYQFTGGTGTITF